VRLTLLCYHSASTLRPMNSTDKSTYERQTDDLPDNSDQKQHVLFPRIGAR
jgi:hypothetical protein